MAPRHCRKTIWDGPCERAETQSVAARAFRRTAGLSHRSLSRKRDRPEPDGVSVRQRNVRADLESPLYRSRADHRGGTVGVEQRAGYYDGAGALRDMVQNHLMQLLTLIAMEPPVAFTADSVRDRKMDALLSVQPIINRSTGEGLDAVVRAQYAAGWVDGKQVPGYRDEPGVNRASTTETFTALRLELDSWRWAGVPFYLRTGKRLPKRVTEIAIQFKRPPLQIFKQVSPTPVASNLLIINVQPDEGISLRFEAKLPSTRMQLAPVMMNFRYGTTFGGEVPEAYETLLLDALIGDPTLFARHDFVEASWALIFAGPRGAGQRRRRPRSPPMRAASGGQRRRTP